MGASLSLAVFAALVAAITVVASMTVIGAVGLLLYSAIKQEEEDELLPPQIASPPPRPLDLQTHQQPIDARRLLGFFDEEESSLARFDPSRIDPQFEVPFGTPEWTEEEGATEIFSAHNAGELSEFAFAETEDEQSRLAALARSR